MYSDYDILFGQLDGFTWFLIFALLAFALVCEWKIFEKAGEPGWAAIVPFYNNYVEFKICFGNGWLFLVTLIPIVGWIFTIWLCFKMAKVFGQGVGFGFGLLFLGVIFEAIIAFDESIQYVGIEKKDAE